MSESIGTARLDVVVNTDGVTTGVEKAKRSTQEMAGAVEQSSKRQKAALEKSIATFGMSRQEVLRWTIAQRASGKEAERLNAALDRQVAKMAAQTRAQAGMSGSLNRVGGSLKSMALGWAAAATAALSVGAAFRSITDAIDFADKLNDMNQRLGVSAEALSGWAYAAKQTGTDIDALGVGLKKLAKNMAEALDPKSQQANLFKALGVQVTDAEGRLRKLEDVLPEVADGFAGIKNETLKVALATELLGKSGSDLIEFFNQGAAGLETMQDRARELGIVLSQETLSGADAFNDKVAELKTVSSALATQLAAELLPALTKLVTTLVEATKPGTKTAAVIELIGDMAGLAATKIQVMSAEWDAFGDLINSLKKGADAYYEVLFAITTLDFSRAKKGLAEIRAAGEDASDTLTRPLIPRAAPNVTIPGMSFTVPGLDKNRGFSAVPLTGVGTGAPPSREDAINRVLSGVDKAKTGAKKSGSDGIEEARSRAAIQALEDQLKKEQALLANQLQIVEANYSARNISAAEYYAEQKRLAQENTDVQVRALEGEIAALKSRSLSGKDSINNARELAEKEAELAKVRADGATKLQVLNIQEAAQIKQRQQANVAYQDALDESSNALKAELESQVLRIKVGEREYEIRSRIIQLYRDEAKELLNLARQRDAGEIDEQTFQQRSDQLKKAIAGEVQIVRDGYDQMAEAQKNWANGALKAFADYSDAANDVAGQTYSMFSNALTGIEDELTDFITKGKADWKGLFDSMYAEVVRFTIRQGLNKVIKKFLPGMEDGEGGNAQALTGAAASLAASATPLYGAAAALNTAAAALAAAGTGGAATGGQGASDGWLSTLAGLFSGGGTTTDGWFGFWKNGGAFANGMPVNYFARGDVFDRATAFPMRGGMGVMGEAGPEAIMPLKRGSDGRLGVEVNGNSQPGNVSVVQNISVMGSVDRRAREAIRADTGRNVNRALKRNGG